MVVRIRDLLPFGDLDDSVPMRMGERFPDLPVEHVAAALEIGRSVVTLIEAASSPLEEAGLSPAQWRLLIALSGQTERGEATVGELAGHLGVREPTVTATIDRAERAGLVARRRSPEDGRVVVVGITGAGRRRLAELVPVLAARLSLLVERLGGPDAARALARRITDASQAVAEIPTR